MCVFEDKYGRCMDIIKIDDRRYEEYGSLLIKRDELKKEAGSFMTSYICEFGRLITEVYEAEIRCIEKKKTIAYCRSKLNRGEVPEAKSVKDFIISTMHEYYEELAEMIDSNKAAREAKIFTEETVGKCNKLYKQIAKMIHPDLNPRSAESVPLQDLWNRTVEAHLQNDPKTLEELLLLANKTVKDEDLEGIAIEIPDIDEKIKNIRLEIDEILNTAPYTYGALLRDPLKVDELKTELQLSKENYEAYAKELDEILAEMPITGGTGCQMN